MEFQETLRRRLLSACRQQLKGVDPVDVVQEALLRTHLRVLMPSDAVRDPTGLAMKILVDVIVDWRRRKKVQTCADPDSRLCAASTDSGGVVRLGLGKVLIARLRKIFRGKIQRAILEGLVMGWSLKHVAARLVAKEVEVERVANEMMLRLRLMAGNGVWFP